MKKILPLFAILLAFAWCWIQPTEEAPVQEIQEDEVVVTHVWDDDAFFFIETEWWWIALIPAWVSEFEELKSRNQFTENAVAWEYSKYLIAWYWLINDTKETVTFWPWDIPDIYDSEWRRFETDIELTSDFYLPNAIRLLDVKPWIPENWFVVYEVPKNATWFYVQAWATRIMMDDLWLTY